MKAEIKNRIEQIRQGKVPAGYKKSAIGIFPEDWEIVSLSRFFSFKNGINAEKGSFGRGTKLISVKDILSEQAITYDSIQGMISLDEKQKEAFKVHYGDILFQRSSENYEDVGKSNVYLDKKRDAVFSGFVIRGQKIVDYDPVYLNEVLRLPYVRKQIQRLGAGAQHINIGQDSLKNVHIAVAGKKEQEKLTSICLQQMKVIRFKENLLAEKLRQKQYLMQVLLTGKKRLPGYKGKWKTIHFGEVFSFGSTNSFSRQFMVSDGDGIHNIHYGDILTKYGEILDARITKLPVLMKEAGEKIKDFISDGDIVIADTAEDLTAGKVIEVQNVGTQKIAAGMHTMWCTPKRGYFAPGWLGFYMNSMHFHRQLIPYMAGIKVMAISKTNIVKTHLLVPSIDEQCAIVTILTCADREIELLKKGLEQERRKKKALMQLLLSGIVRVKP
jgi:hypothetical protein